MMLYTYFLYLINGFSQRTQVDDSLDNQLRLHVYNTRSVPATLQLCYPENNNRKHVLTSLLTKEN